jgi:hypothetical protein
MKGIGGALIVIGAIVALVGSLLYGALLVVIGIGLVVLGSQKGGAPKAPVVGEPILYQFKCATCGTHGIIRFEPPAAAEFADINATVIQERTKACSDCKTPFTAKAVFAHPLQAKQPFFEPAEAK